MAGGGLVRFSVLRSSQLLISCLRDLRLQSSFLEGKMPALIDSSVSLNDGRKVRISYKGVPGAYSEAAALKAYSQCENVPCNKFEDAFKVDNDAVKLWLADKTVLPIENSLGGSIHRNYDLLLWHKLHIVGEVQLAVNLCLLALPGVRTEHLKRVLSHPQLVASNELRDAGAVASARAAEIYGLDILAERIQDPYILCWDIRKAVDIVFKLYRSSENTNQRILFDIDPFGQHLGTGSEDGLVQIYNLQMGQWVSSFQAALDTVNCFSFHPFLPMAGSSSGKICKLR
ncbi:hypothetical protein CsSME_00007495 [Camellia sinensis var. sinensis]